MKTCFRITFLLLILISGAVAQGTKFMSPMTFGNNSVRDQSRANIMSGLRVSVLNDAARFAQTVPSVQNGSIVYVSGTGKSYMVVDQTQLSSNAGYAPFPSSDSVALQLRQGLADDLAHIVPASGEPVWTTDTLRLSIGDGVTTGGIPIPNMGLRNITLGVGSFAQGTENDVAQRWAIATYNHTTKTLVTQQPFTTEFAVGNLVSGGSPEDDTYGQAKITSVNTGTQTIVFDADVLGGADIDDGSGYSYITQGQNPTTGKNAVVFGLHNNASGDESIAWGTNSIASGASSTAFSSGHAIGDSSFAAGGNALGAGSVAINGESTGSGAIAIGGTATGFRSVAFPASNSWWPLSVSTGAVQDQAQTITVQLCAQTSGASTAKLGQFFTSGNTNDLSVQSGVYACTLTVVGRDSTNTNCAMFTRRFLIKRFGSTTSLIGSVQTVGTDIGTNSGGVPSGWAVNISADDTNDKILITVNQASGNGYFSGKLEAVYCF